MLGGGVGMITGSIPEGVDRFLESSIGLWVVLLTPPQARGHPASAQS